MAEYTNYNKAEATKDPIDCLRYLCVSNCEFVDVVRAADAGSTFSY